MLIKSSKDKLDVKISIRNSKDNAYNTKVTLSFSPNINFVKAEVSCVEFLSATPLFPGFRALTCVFLYVWYSHRIPSGGLHSEPHQGGLRRRIPLPWEQRGGQFQLISPDSIQPSATRLCFPSPERIMTPLCSCLQEQFRVTFEANPKHIQEFIQINITATR